MTRPTGPTEREIHAGLAATRQAQLAVEDARQRLEAGRVADALDLLEPWTRSAPITLPWQAEALLLSARAWSQTGRPDRARACCETVMKSWQHVPARGLEWAAAVRELGDLHLGQGRWRHAVQAYRRAAERRPLDPGCWAGLSAAAQQLGRRRLERQAAKRLASVAPGREAATHLARRITVAAMTACAQSAACRRPQDPLSPDAGADAWRELAHHAGRALEARITRQDAHADLWRRLADCRAVSGDRPASTRACDQALRLNPRYAHAMSLRRRLEAA
ncbi:MAG: hypothetical protein AAF288_05295 [Planctomycetota bacterium]